MATTVVPTKAPVAVTPGDLMQARRRVPSWAKFLLGFVLLGVIIGMTVQFWPSNPLVTNIRYFDWVSYSNPEANFTFKYPKDWEIFEFWEYYPEDWKSLKGYGKKWEVTLTKKIEESRNKIFINSVDLLRPEDFEEPVIIVFLKLRGYGLPKKYFTDIKKNTRIREEIFNGQTIEIYEFYVEEGKLACLWLQTEIEKNTIVAILENPELKEVFKKIIISFKVDKKK